MKPLAEQKCPACTAPMRFDPGQGKLVCDYCGMTVDIPADPKSAPVKRPGLYEDVPGKIQGFDFKNMTQQVTDLGAQKLPIYNCVSCGAEVIAPAEQMALTCPYCGNNIVLTEKVTGGLRPNSVIPFRIQPDSLPAAVSRFHRWKSLLPRGYFSKSTMGSVPVRRIPASSENDPFPSISQNRFPSRAPSEESLRHRMSIRSLTSLGKPFSQW